MHDPTKTLLGSVPSTCKDVSRHDADPASFPAGTAVRRSSSGGLVVAANGTAALIGVSCGKDLSDNKKTAVARTGTKIPLLLTNQFATLTKGSLTFTALAAGSDGNTISVEFLDTETDGGETVNVINVTGNLIQVGMEDGASTATHIKTAIDANIDAAALISTAIAGGEGSNTQSAFAEEFLANGGGSFVEGQLGQPVRLNTTTGKATNVTAGSAVIAAVYVSGELTGVKEDGTTAPVALVDMLGGL